MISLITFFIMIKWEIFIRTSELFQMKSWRIFNFSLFRQPHEIMSKGGDRDLDLFTYHLELPCRNTICSVLKMEQIVQWHICLLWCNVASFKISAKNKNIDLYFCLAGKENCIFSRFHHTLMLLSDERLGYLKTGFHVPESTVLQ